jgi:cell division septum initiation protein DivIVA
MKQDRVIAMNWEHIAVERAEEIEQLKAVIVELKEKIARLEKNSSSSSKPPSSDMVKPSKEP